MKTVASFINLFDKTRHFEAFSMSHMYTSKEGEGNFVNDSLFTSMSKKKIHFLHIYKYV